MRRRASPHLGLAIPIALIGLVASIVSLAACAVSPSPDAAPPSTSVGGVDLAPHSSSLPIEQARVLHALSPDGPARIPIHSLVHGGGHGAGAFGDQPRVAAPLDTRDPHLRAQLDAARATVRQLMRMPHLESARYYLGSYFTPGVGVHYIDWHLVGRKFDAAHPAMLLVDATPGHRVRLAGLSYWVRSDGPPAGFAGRADVWHQHRGLCFVDGLLARDAVPAAAACRGNWLNGRDLWMLHVWVVPGFENDAGTFAPYNRALCPSRTGLESSWC